MQVVKTPCLVKNLLTKSLTWEIRTRKKELFLTFDDGPHPEITGKVLDLLKQYNAKATFFCVGENASKYPEVIERIKAEGHQLGNHTFNHLDGWKTKTKEYVQNVSKCAKEFDSKLFRPPYGHIKPAQIAAIKPHFNIVMWSILSYDFDKSVSPEECLNNVISNGKKGSIVVFHDSEKSSANMLFTLPKVLEHFSNKKYSFPVIDPKKLA